MDNTAQMPKLKMLMLIISNKDARKAEAVLRHFPAHICRGEGTATSEIMDYLGLGSTGKTIILCTVPWYKVQDVFDLLRKELHLDRPGKGIAFTFPVSGVSIFLMRLFSDDIRQEAIKHIQESDVNLMANPAAHSLIIVTVNQGYSDTVMDAARAAGAGGGTVLHTRRAGLEEAVNHFGIAMHKEREMVLILASQENKIEIMKAVGEKCGLRSEAQGMAISVPVDAVTGIDEDKKD